jgi:hypothetical protein
MERRLLEARGDGEGENGCHDDSADEANADAFEEPAERAAQAHGIFVAQHRVHLFAQAGFFRAPDYFRHHVPR